MKVAVFWGCRILTSQYAYEMSTRQVLLKLGIDLVDLREMHCCGNAVESVNKFTATYMASRVIALANEKGLENLLFPCGRCHFTVSETQRLLALDNALQEKIVGFLKEENLTYSPDIKLWHIIDLLHDVVGTDRIRENVKIPLKGLRLASHIGCQAIRPSYMKRVDNSENPVKMDLLIKALGAESINYSGKLDCCGAALMLSHPEAALSLAGSKLDALQKLGVDGLVDSCPAGHVMFDTKQEEATSIIGSKVFLPILNYTQLLGLAFGIDAKELGLHLNKSPIERILEKLNLTYHL